MEVPLRIDRFEVLGELGRGGQGMVLLAYDPKLERQVAVKVLNQELVDNPISRARFHREAKATAKLHHPNVVEVFDYSPEDAALAYIVSERLEGKTLSQVLALRSQPLTAPVAAAVGHEIALALQHAHEKTVVHRDLKPDNVFWEPSGRIVLVDFGIAKAIDAREGSGAAVNLTEASQVLGTPHYLAPEIVLREGASYASDLFSLGALLHFLVTKQEAFAEDSLLGVLKRIVNGAPHPLARPDLPKEYVALVASLLSVDPKQRPRSAEDVADALMPIVARGSSPDPRRVLKSALSDLQAETGVWNAPAPKSLNVTTDERVRTVITKVASLSAPVEVTPEQTRIATVAQTAPASLTAPHTKSKVPLVFATLALVLLVVAGVAVAWKPTKPPPPVVVALPAEPVVDVAPSEPPPTLPAPTEAETIAQPAALPREKKIVKPVVAKVDPTAPVRMGTLKLVALPWAEVFIDGEKVGTTPGFRTRMLSSGRHRVRAENPAFTAKERDVDVKPDDTTFVDLSFE